MLALTVLQSSSRLSPGVRWDWKCNRGNEGAVPAIRSKQCPQQGEHAKPLFSSIKKKAGEIIPSTFQWLPWVGNRSSWPVSGTQPQPMPSLRSYSVRNPAQTAGASTLPRLRSQVTPPPTLLAARCCRGPGTAQLQGGPMANRPGLRPAPADQWRHDAGTAQIKKGPIAAWPGTGPPSLRRIGGEAVTGSSLLPSDPVSRFCLFLFQTTWTRGGLRGCRAAGGNPGRHSCCRRHHRGCDSIRRLSEVAAPPCCPRLAQSAHMATQTHSLCYAGCNFLRQRLVLSTLSGRPVKIRKIRARDDNPGLRGNGSTWGGRGATGRPLRCYGDRRAESLGVPRAFWGTLVARRPKARMRPRRWGRRGRARRVSSAACCAPRLQGAGSKQLHVFQHYVLS